MTVEASADVSPDAVVAESARVWHLAQVREGAVLEADVIVGRGAYIGIGVHVGVAAKIQNLALVYEPASIGAGAFIGPGAILTNDRYPRSVDASGTQKGAEDWQPVGVHVGEGASIGARAVCVAPATIGAWAMVGAGSVVIGDVPDYALVVGSPARRIGWVGPAGVRLEVQSDGSWRCPVSGDLFDEVDSDMLVPKQDSSLV